MSIDLGAWAREARKQQLAYDSLVRADPVQAVLRRNTRGGRTNLVRLVCGNHSSGWSVAMNVRARELVFFHDDGVDPKTLRGVFLKAFPRSGQTNLNCPTCNRVRAVKQLELLIRFVRALDSPRHRNHELILNLP